MGAPETVMPSYVQPAPGVPPPGAIPTYPSPYGGSLGGGIPAHLVDKNKIINDSVQNAINETQQLQKMHRDTTAFNEQQTKNKDTANAANPNATPGDHTSFSENLMHGLNALGAGVKQIFGGAPAAPAGIPAPAAGPPPAAIAANTPDAPPAPMPGIQPQMRGGVVVGDFSGPTGGASPAGLIGMDPPAQPSVLSRMNGGGIPGYADGGPVDRGAIINAGTQNAINQSQQLQGMQRDSTKFSQDQASRGAMADASRAPQEEMVHQIDELHKDMHAHALGDDDVPNNSRGIAAPQTSDDPNAGPSPAAPAASADQGPPAPGAPQGPAPAAPGPTGGAPPQGIAAPKDPNQPDPNDPKVQASAGAAQQVINAPANDPAKTGVQVTSPSAEDKPHSITADKWNEWDDRINKAVHSAALAGQDPGQVRQALEANRNAYIQGHVLRYLSSANVAIQNGDSKGVEAALKNAYYYMPDGQNLSIKKDAQGNLMYQDPVNPIKIDGNNKSQPNMIPVDSAHIQLLGQAMLDPMQVNKTLMEIRSAARERELANAKIQLEGQQGLAARDTGQGNLMKGRGILDSGESHVARVKSQNYKDLSEGDAAVIRAKALDFKLRNTIHNEKLDPQLLKGAQDASDGYEKAVQGQLTTVQGDPLTNPNVGKSTRDPTKSAVPGATPRDVASGKAIAGQIMLGARGTMAPGRAIELAIMATEAKRGNSAKPDSKTGKVTKSPDFHTDPKTGDSWVWNKALQKWETFKLPLTSANAAASGKLGITDEDLDDATKAELASNGGIGGGQSADSSQQASADAPDMKDQEFPAES